MGSGSMTDVPPLPPGFVLDAPAAGPPPLPPGFVLDAPASASVGETAADMAKQLGTGAVTGTLGLPGDLASLLNKGIDWGTNKFGLGVAPSTPVGTSAQITKGLEQLTGSSLAPKTTLGEYARTAGEFAPAMLGGPESVFAKLVTRVAAPAIASEGLGQLTAGTAAEPFARLGGALVGGGGAAALANRAEKIAAPTLEQIGTAKAADYKAVNDLGVTFKPQAVKTMASDIAAGLEKQGITADVAPVTFKVLEKLESRTSPATINDIDNTRKILGQLAKGSTSPNTMERINAGAAQQAIREIDQALPAFAPADFASGARNHAQAIEHLTNARGNAAVEFQAKALDRAEYKATNNAAAANSGANYENALRQQLKSILNSPAQARQFPPTVRAEMEKIVRGEGTRNMIRTIGNLLGGGGGVGALASAMSGHALLPGAGLAAPFVGAGIKKAGNAVTERAVERLNEKVRAASPLAQAQRASLPPPNPITSQQQLALMNALLSLRGGSTPLPIPQAQAPYMPFRQ